MLLQDLLPLIDQARALNGRYMYALGLKTPKGIVIRGYNVPLDNVTIPQGEQLVVTFYLQPINGRLYLGARNIGYVEQEVAFFYEPKIFQENPFEDGNLYLVDCDIQECPNLYVASLTLINCSVQRITYLPDDLYVINSDVSEIRSEQVQYVPNAIVIDGDSTVHTIGKDVASSLDIEGQVYSIAEQPKLTALNLNTSSLRFFPRCPNLVSFNSTDADLNTLMGGKADDPEAYNRLSSQYPMLFIQD